MTIVLTILKIIGLVLLALLSLLLAVLLLALFVPIRYRVDGAYEEKIEAKGQVTWLLHFLSVKVVFDGTLQYCVRVAGIRLLPKREARHKRKQKKNSGVQNAEEPAFRQDDGHKSAAIENEKMPESPERGDKLAGETAEKDTLFENAESIEETAREESQNFLLALISGILDILRNCREKFRAIHQKIIKIRDNISYYIKILEREETKRALSDTFTQLKGIIRHVLPKDLDVCFRIGTGDPASTGQLLALQGMLYPVLQNKVRIVPDFDEKLIEGTFHAKGRIRAAVLLICGFRVLINKNFRQLIRLLRKKEET